MTRWLESCTLDVQVPPNHRFLRNKLKVHLKKTWIFLVLFFFLSCPTKASFPHHGFTANSQRLEVGISYLDLRKSFLDFPIEWRTTMPIVSLSYEFASRRFSHRLCLDYGRSSYIKVNDSRRWGKNNFSILGFQYDLLWRKKRRKENPVFFWGLGVSLENRRISQKTEMSPGSYNTYEDHYFGIGPTLSLLWRLGRAEFGLGLASSVFIPHASFGILRSDAAFSDRSYLHWVRIEADLHYRQRISEHYAISIELERDALAYGRTHEETIKPKNYYPYGSLLSRSVRIALSYNFQPPGLR